MLTMNDAFILILNDRAHPADPIWWYLTRIATIQIPALLFLAGGITLALRHGGGLYWMLPATLTAFIGAVYTAWILLVEIMRHNRRSPHP